MQDPVSMLFDRMDSWRHLPNYQLERRADLFFSLYLPEALEAKLGFAVRAELVPEFPVRIGTIHPQIDTNKSFKIDYVALSTDGSKAMLVELKTEGLSRRTGQDRYLEAAKDVGLGALIEGLLMIFRATNAKRKYFCLLDRLSHMGLLEIPDEMRRILDGPDLRGIDETADRVRVTCDVAEHHIVYVQPQGSGPGIISFDEFGTTVGRHDDPLSRRFARSLDEWGRVPAGQASSGGGANCGE